MRLFTAIAAFTTLLFSTAGEAVAAVEWAPRMERVASCSWDRPGHNPFMGDVVGAIDRYIDIPTPVRMRLKQRMQARQYDDLVDIRRDEISGRERYEPVIREMHFGLDRVCRQVTRERWSAQMHERGLVYCEQGHCILVPTVCRNVSRIERRPALLAGTAIAGPAAASEAPLNFAAPSAGPAPAESHATAGPATQPAFTEAVAAAAVPPWADAGGPGSGGSGSDGDPQDIRPAGYSAWPSSSGGAGGGQGGAGNGDGFFGRIDGPLRGGTGFPDGSGTIGLPNLSVAADPPGGGGAGDPPLAVPEPGTWASLLIGLLLLAVVSARQRSGHRGARR